MSKTSNNSESKDLDCVHASRGVWLVKVPKYISDRWNKSKDNEVGRLRITKGPAGKRDIILTLSDNVVKTATDDKQQEIPQKHKFVISTISSQSLAVFSQAGEKVGMEGRVIQRAECRPMASDDSYMQLKKKCILLASKPVRSVKQLDHVVNPYKPVSDHKNNIEFEEKKKAEGKKSREDKDKVLEMLFAAFEKHQYYNIKDLVRITRQPITYLKEILKDICTYNLKKST
ncbi:hypothetical protein CHUAL_007572 [Chamberlinius hualienensis]